MKTNARVALAAVAAFMLSPAAAHAAVGQEPSLLAVPSAAVMQMVTWRVPEPSGPLSPETPVTLALTQVPAPARVEFSGVHYQPHSSGGSHRQPESAGVSQLHMGFFDPDGRQGSRFDLGVRGGPMLDKRLQAGLGVDWIYNSEQISSVSTAGIGPGGVPIVVRQNISRASTNMFPIMGFVQISAPVDMGFVPYFGVGGGYQVLWLSGEDFTTGLSYDGTFSGWGWQAWGGVGMPLGGRTRLTSEVFFNGAELGRDVIDYSSGFKVHETVNADGMGLRFGVAWGY